MHYDNENSGVGQHATVRKQTTKTTYTKLAQQTFLFLIWCDMIYALKLFLWDPPCYTLMIFHQNSPDSEKAGCPAEIVLIFETEKRGRLSCFLSVCGPPWAALLWDELDGTVELPRVQSVNPELTRARGKSSKRPSYKRAVRQLIL